MLQSTAAFHYIIQQDEIKRGKTDFKIIICDVDSKQNPDAEILSKYFAVISKRNITNNDSLTNIKEKEKQDYIFCLRQAATNIAANVRNVIMVEDDALPGQDFLPVVENILKTRKLDNVAFIKVIHISYSVGCFSIQNTDII